MLAIVLERRDFREFDQIITLLTLEQGKITVLARGLKKITAKNASALEPSSLIEVEIVPGKEIAHLIKSQVIEIFASLRHDLKKIAHASTVLRLVDRLIKGEEPDARIFELVRSFLFFIESSSAPAPGTIAGLVLKLVSELGFTPILDRCVLCGVPLPPQATYVFDLGGGGVICQACVEQKKFAEHQLVGNVSATTLDRLKFFLSAEWDEIQASHHEPAEDDMVEALVYHFALYHSGQKLPDWRNMKNIFNKVESPSSLANISEI